MSANATLRSSNGFPGQPGGEGAGHGGPAWPRGARRTGLWVFMAVVTTLFGLFGVAYMMRAAYEDWRPIGYVPWQLWCSTALLLLCSLSWQLARRHVLAQRRAAARSTATGALLLSLMFVVSQLYAWQAMTAADYGVAGNPANSFFYLITGLHALHVLGGMVAAGLVLAGFLRGRSTEAVAEGLGLCAQYWHFLFVLWLAIFGLLYFVTPDVVRALCTTMGIPVR